MKTRGGRLLIKHHVFLQFINENQRKWQLAPHTNAISIAAAVAAECQPTTGTHTAWQAARCGTIARAAAAR